MLLNMFVTISTLENWNAFLAMTVCICLIPYRSQGGPSEQHFGNNICLTHLSYTQDQFNRHDRK